MDQNEAINSINSDLIRGHIDTIILKALQAGDRYGYDIIKEIEHKSEGQYIIKQPTLYSCLKRLEVQGFVKSYWGSKSIGGRKKYFTLTDLGRELFVRNINDWNYSRDVINKLISDDDYSYDKSEQNDLQTIEEIPLELEETEILQSDDENIEEIQAINDGLSDESTDAQEENEPEIIEEIEVSDADYEENESEQIDETEDNEDDMVEPESESNEDDGFDLNEDDEDEIQEPYSDLDEDEGEIEISDDADEEAAELEKIDETAELTNDESIVDPYLAQSISEEEQPSQQAHNDEADVYDDLPLSIAEQNHALEDSHSIDEENSELVSKFYDEQNQESYITNADNAEYTSQQNDFLDVYNYFKDIQYDNLEEEEVASALSETEIDIPEESSEPQSESTNQRFETYRRFVREPEEPKTIFYSYKNAVPNDNSSVIESEYRGVISKLISDNIIISDPYSDNGGTKAAEYFKSQVDPKHSEREAEAHAISEQFASDTGDKIDLRTHNLNAVKAYNKKHYYYSNQLKLFQYGILFGIMLLDIVLCFYFIEVLHNSLNVSKITLALYIIAVVLAALFPIISFFMASSNYYKRKRINYSGKSSALFSIAVTVLLVIVIFFVNVYGGILIGDINNYLSSLIMPIVLSTNVIANAIIFHYLYKSGKYNIEE